MFPGTGFPFKQFREQISRENGNHYHVHESVSEIPDNTPRSPNLPTAREYAAYVASFVVGLTLAQGAKIDSVEATLGHISTQVVSILGGLIAATSIMRWAYQECHFIKRTVTLPK